MGCFNPQLEAERSHWVPAFAGMTPVGVRPRSSSNISAKLGHSASTNSVSSQRKLGTIYPLARGVSWVPAFAGMQLVEEAS